MTEHGPAGRVSLEALLEHRDWVRALARRLVSDPNRADDVEQETWRMALEHPPRHGGALRAWFATVVRNAARKSGGRETRRAVVEADAPPPRAVPSPADLVAQTELQHKLVQAVLELDEPYRATILYRFFEGFEASEIAARLGVPVETVRTRVKRGVERLRERMDAEIGEDRDAWCLLVFGVRADAAPRFVPGAKGGAAATLTEGIAMTLAMKLLVSAAIVAAGLAWWLAPKTMPQESVGETAKAAAETEQSAVAPAQHRAARTKTSSADNDTTEAPTPSVTETQIPLGPDVVHGRVIDAETGKPVAGASVTFINEWVPVSLEPPPPAITAADGSFRTKSRNTKLFPTIVLRADGYAESVSGFEWLVHDASGASKETTDAGDVRIYRGKRVAGRVLATDGRTPVAGAEIHLSSVEWMFGAMVLNQSAERGTTAIDGTFAIEQVAPIPAEQAPDRHGDVYTIFAVSSGGLGWTTLPGDTGRIDTKNVDITLRPNGAATVTVRDEAGAPRPGVHVVASPLFEPLGRRPDAIHDQDGDRPKASDVAALFVATTDAHGVARFAVLPTSAAGSPYEFIVDDMGAKRWSENISVRAGQDAAVEIVDTASTKWSIAGVVRRADGTPAAGAVIESRVDGSTMTTGPDGSFRIEGLAPSLERHKFAVGIQGCATVVREVRHDAGKDVAEIDVVLQPVMPVAGRVADQDGRPVAGALLSLEGTRSDAGVDPVMPVYSGSDGKFEFADAPAGSWRLMMFPPKPLDEWEIEVREDRMPAVHGGDRDVVAVLRRADPGKARLVVTLVDEAGAPLAPDEAQLVSADDGPLASRIPSGKTELGNGRAVIERVKTGHWSLQIRVPDRIGTIVPLDVADGQTEIALRVVVPRPGKLRGRVELGGTGAAMPSTVTPSMTSNSYGPLPDWARAQTAAARVQPDGTFEFPEVMPGRWRVSVDENGVAGEAIVEVPAGGDVVAVVKLTRAAAGAPVVPK